MNKLTLTLKLSSVHSGSIYLDSLYPKYLFKSVDSNSSSKLKEKSFSVFIIPQGQEKSWTFSTLEGLLDLVQQINTSRVLFIYLGRGYIFRDLESVQEELKTLVLSFMPPVCSTSKVAFMTNGDIGEKALIYSSAQAIVEDVKEGDYYLRQLIFISNVNQVQSEIRIDQGPEGSDSIFYENSLVKYPVRPNYSFLTFECQRAMLLSLAFDPNKTLNQRLKILLLGAGACVFPTFILKYFENAEIIAVDIDRQVVDIGIGYFGVTQDSRFSVVIEDAENFIKSYEGESFDFVFLDICIGNADVQTPPPQFTSPEFTSLIGKIMKEDAIFCVNLIGSDSQIIKMENEFKSVFKKVLKCKCKDDTNKIVFCFKYGFTGDWKDLTRGVKEVEKVKAWDQTMQLVEYAGWVKAVEDSLSAAQAILQGKKKNRRNKKRN